VNPRSAAAPEIRELPAVIKNLVLCAAGLALCGGAAAATVDVIVADGAGKPLADAVVMLEPTAARLPVKPVSGVQITQVRRQFDPQVTVIPVGTAVTFPNLDTVRHHVYSFSGAKTFELKLYAGVPAAPVVFDKAGIAVLGCNIHDQMVAWVVVVDTPFYARSSALGKASIAAVPAGAYRLKVWHSSLADASTPVASALVVGNADLEQHATLRTDRRSP
jgi:plastocyanin